MKKKYIPPHTDAEGELTTLRKDLEAAKKHIELLTETSKRALADLANFKRRNEKEKKEFIEFANARLILELLQITDSFERAVIHMPGELQSNDWAKGITQIEKQFHDILKRHGVKEIEAKGAKLDPNYHEALLTSPGEKDMVIEVLEKGYILGERVLRQTKVSVGDGQQNK
jgi:molecular chaperone GrpE